jgi:hypothetical protein
MWYEISWYEKKKEIHDRVKKSRLFEDLRGAKSKIGECRRKKEEEEILIESVCRSTEVVGSFN